MKVLFLTSTDMSNPKRGTLIRISKFVEQLQLYNFNVTVVAKGVTSEEGITFIRKPQKPALLRLFFLARLVRKNKIDYVLTATTVDIKMVVLLKILTGVKIAIDIHGLSHEEDFYFQKISSFKKNLKEFFLKRLLPFFDVVFVVSEKARRYFINNNKNIHVVYGGASLQDFSSLKDTNLGLPLEIGYMGNTRKYQGLEYLLDAVALFVRKGNSISLKLVVSEEVSALREMLNERGLLSYTDIHQNIKHEDVFSFFENTNAFVIPRPSLPLTEYAFPSKLTECLASGRVVITTSVGPVNELLSDREDSLIVEPGDPIAILNALEELQSLSAEERTSIGVKGRKVVEERLQWSHMGEIIAAALT